MAIYHLHVKNISRGDGRSAVAAAAYRAGETLANEAEEGTSAFGGRRDVLHAEIRAPAGAPAWMGERGRLWAAVEAAEKRKDARLAKEIEFSLPRELPVPAWLPVAREMADLYAAQGYVVDLAIHSDGGNQNPHVHLMLTTRAVTGEGFGGKLREADGRKFVTDARAAWQRIANAALGKAGAGVEIDGRSHAARGIGRAPTAHRGPDPAERRARREGRGTMPLDIDTLETRNELLAERGTQERFPLLSARPDWPPESRTPPGGLAQPERDEFRAFWREIDRRRLEAPLQARQDVPEGRSEREEPVYETEAALDVRQASALDAVQSDADRREAELERLLPDWRELHEALTERMRAEGHDVSHPLHDWQRVEAAMRRFDQQLTAIREREALNRTLRERWGGVEHEIIGEPDPDGRPIPPAELERAEAAMLEEHARPAHEVLETPRPESMPAAERADARAAVERLNAVPVSDREAEGYRLSAHEDHLDWLRDELQAPQREVDRERERGR